ncbi:hypothetical protein PG991_000763 [Apiospora marii]|uniref:Uncharacterized protein n=1 Tax=Apiospora marii TaxID=335849 RepID=A0ABR1ST72_9PEZI
MFLRGAMAQLRMDDLVLWKLGFSQPIVARAALSMSDPALAHRVRCHALVEDRPRPFVPPAAPVPHDHRVQRPWSKPWQLGKCVEDPDVTETKKLAKKHGYKQCPDCKTLIELNEGCHHMLPIQIFQPQSYYSRRRRLLPSTLAPSPVSSAADTATRRATTSHIQFEPEHLILGPCVALRLTGQH